ncbi:MAG: hypothetical protein HRF45_07120 [Fimbriimonadia bacterium]|jgi:hypothetical protein
MKLHMLIAMLSMVVLSRSDDPSKHHLLFSSGAPEVALPWDSNAVQRPYAPPDASDPDLTPIVPYVVSSADSRYAMRFVLRSSARVDLLQLAVRAGAPDAVSVRIYADNDGVPGQLIESASRDESGDAVWTATYYSPNAVWFVDQSVLYLVVDFTQQSSGISLDAGAYWMTVHGTDDPLNICTGAPGGSNRSLGIRFTDDSDWEDFETWAYAAASYSTNIVRWFSSGWFGNELPGSSIYRPSFALYELPQQSGLGGGRLTGSICISGWAGDNRDNYFREDSGFVPEITPESLWWTYWSLSADIVLTAPGELRPIIVETVALTPDDSAPRLSYDVRHLQPGTYDVYIFPRHYHVAKWTCSDGQDDYGQTYLRGLGHPFVPTCLGQGVLLTENQQTVLGPSSVASGDVDLDASVALSDVSLVLLHLGSTVRGSCPPSWESYHLACDVNCDGSIDLADLSLVLINLSAQGPSRW